MASSLLLASEDFPLLQAHLWICFFKFDRFIQHFWVFVTREFCYFSQLTWQAKLFPIFYTNLFRNRKKVLKTQVWTLLPVFSLSCQIFPTVNSEAPLNIWKSTKTILFCWSLEKSNLRPLSAKKLNRIYMWNRKIRYSGSRARG